MNGNLLNIYKFNIYRATSVNDDGSVVETETALTNAQGLKCHYKIERNREMGLNSGIALHDPHPAGSIIYDGNAPAAKMGDYIYLYLQEDDSLVGKFVVSKMPSVNKLASGKIDSRVLEIKLLSYVDSN